MDVICVSSKADPNHLVTVPYSHRGRCVHVHEDGGPNATRGSPTLDLLMGDPQRIY